MRRKGWILVLAVLIVLSASIVTFGWCSESIRFQAAVNYWNPVTRNFFLSLIPTSDSGDYTINQICDIFDYCISHWTYVDDPAGLDYVSSAGNTIQNGLHGDCDDFAVLMAAGIVVIGGTARIETVANKTEGHAYAQVYVADGDTPPQWLFDYLGKRYNPEPNTLFWYSHGGTDGGAWLNLDWSARYPGGPICKLVDSTTCEVYNSGRR